MALTRLFCQNLRSIQSADIQPDPGINIFYGANGAGKTSLLEAIHILSTGRSFRTPLIRNVIQYDQESLIVTGTLYESGRQQQVGIQRWKDQVRARINQQPVRHIATLSSVLPVLAFHPVSSRLITDDPGERRAYIDWGVFQIHPEFLKHWRLYRHILKQRNAAIKRKKPGKEISLWDDQLTESASHIHKVRAEYIANLQTRLPQITSEFSIPYELDIEYRPGWNTNQDFKSVLAVNLDRDLSLGYTYAGPHRADMNILLDSHPAASIASRGQLKLITIILKMLQADQLSIRTGRKAILLLDDLPSEFDRKHLKETTQLLERLETQLFITMIEPDTTLFDSNTTKMFHVKHGRVNTD